MIHHRLGELTLARGYLRRALETNPSFHILQAAVAEHALRAVEESSAAAIQETTDDR
jgi:hypothetical protein